MKSGITFQFKDTSEATIFYVASYFGDEHLKIEKQRYHPTKGLSIPKFVKLGPVADPWQTFYENTTFDSILWALLYFPRKEKDESDDWFYTYEFFTEEKDDGSRMPACRPADETFLKAIADKPERLSYPGANDRLQRILRDAATAGTERRKEAKEILVNVIPKHRGGRKYLPKGTELYRMLMKKLAQYLSSKCTDFLKEQNHCVDRREIFENSIWKENYDSLIKWGKKSEHRISTLNRTQLKDLVQKPADYADSILEGTLQIGLRTINTSRSAK